MHLKEFFFDKFLYNFGKQFRIVKIKLSATFEGKCDICKKKSSVFTAGDEETKRVVTICKDCAEKLGTEATSQVIEEYGHPDQSVFEEGVKVEKRPTAG